MADMMRQRGTLVDSFTQMLSSGEFNFDLMPKLITRIIDEGVWRQRAIPQKNWELSREFSSFEEFVTSAPLDGMNTTMQTLKDLCHRDPRAVEAIDRACQRPRGGDMSEYDNIKFVPAPTGTSQPYIMRRLRRDRPDLLEKILAGKLTASAASREAGWGKRVQSVRMDDPDSAARTIKKYMTDPEALARLAELLLQ